MFRIMGVFAIIPATVLLTISFFVLFSLRKQETQGIKAFGYVVAALLWVCTLLVFSMGLYILTTGRHPMMNAMQEMMCGRMHQGMMGQQMPLMQGQKKMMKDKMQGMMQEEEAGESTMKH